MVPASGIPATATRLIAWRIPMKRLSRFLVLAVLGIALVPTAAHAQFLFPLGGFGLGGFGGFGGWPFGGYGYGGWPGYGFGGMPYGYGGFGPNPYLIGRANGLGGWGAYPQATTYITPVVYTVTTPSSTYQRDVPTEPRMRPAVWPAIPYRNAPATDARAFLDLRVPSESAEVSLNGVPMQQSGTNRHFMTPPLAPGKYTFDVRVSWRDAAGKQMTRTRQVEVRPGESQTLDFRTGL
jgi:uncharacterized protein (TIGR03000 family)